MAAETASPAPCAYRRIQRGQTFCSRATDEFDQAVSIGTCLRCPVPDWLAAGICRHLDIGTEVGRNLGAAVPRVLTACCFFGVRLDGLERCRTCPQFDRWDGKSEPDLTPEQVLARSIPGEALEQAMRQALDRHVERERLRMMGQCFRAAAPNCLRSPQFTPNWVLVVPPPSLRANDGYRGLVSQVLKSGGQEGLVFTAELHDIDTLCDLCLTIQQCARIVVDLSEWDTAALFALGLAGGLGRPILMIRGRDATPPFIPQGLPAYEYGTGDELAMLLIQGLGLQIQPPTGEGEAQADAEQGAPGEAAAEPPPNASRPAQRKGPKKASQK